MLTSSSFPVVVTIIGVLSVAVAGLAPLMEADESATIALQYIVKLRNEASVSSHENSFLDAFITKHQEAVVLQKFAMDSDFAGYSIQVPNAEALAEIRANPDVDFIEPNQECTAAWTQKNAPWNLARISQRTLKSSNYVYNTKAGYGVDIYILDTGVNLKHREFHGRASFGASFNGEPGTEDRNGHGTHVAGTAAGKTYGVAKSASIVAVPVLASNGRGSWDRLIAALDWTVKRCIQRRRPCVINMSISGPKSTAVNMAVDKATAAGVHVVVAAGNDATDACTKSPASANSAYTVGATNPADFVSSFSNYGPCVNIFGPGEGIQSAWISSDTSFAYLSGTSMASPHVAGVKALFLSYKYLKPNVLKSVLDRLATGNVIKSMPQKTRNMLIYTSPPAEKLMDQEEKEEEKKKEDEEVELMSDLEQEESNKEKEAKEEPVDTVQPSNLVLQ